MESGSKEASIAELVESMKGEVLVLKEKMEIIFESPRENVVKEHMDAPRPTRDVLSEIRDGLCVMRMSIQEMTKLMTDVTKKLRG